MKGMKGRILKKLKSIPQVPYLKPYALHAFSDPSSPLESNRILDDLLPDRREATIGEHKPTRESNGSGSGPLGENKENISPNPTQTEIISSSFRRPDPNSETLFDPNLLAAFRRAVMEYVRIMEEARTQGGPIEEEAAEDEEPPSKAAKTSASDDEERAPAGGRESIILYTTSLRGIRKTFEDCNSIRMLLENLKLVFVERDLSMHMEFREELWRVLGFRAIPPRVFIKGRYIGGADEVLGLHEQGRLLPLLEGIPRGGARGNTCKGCAGMRFSVCSECNGGRKVYVVEKGMNVQCRRCNENGLVVCSLCCC